MSIKIVTDSTCYIPNELLTSNEIEVVSLSIQSKDKTVRETEIDNSTFYENLLAAPVLPTSSQPPVADFLDVFNQMIQDNHDILGIFISSELSGTLASAEVAKRMILETNSNSNIQLIDSRTTAMELGIYVLEATRLAAEGHTLNEITESITLALKKTRLLFAPYTLHYLEKGGRIGKASALLANTIKIKPILTLQNGEVTIFNKVRTHKRLLHELCRIFYHDIEQCGISEIFVHHINSEEDGLFLASEIEKTTGIKPILVPIGPVIGLHVGPGTIGLAYRTNEVIK